MQNAILVPLLCAAPAATGAGDITLLLEEGQSLPGLGPITEDPFRATVNDSGSWAVAWGTDSGPFVAVDGAVYASSQAPFGTGTFVGVGELMTMGAAGEPVWLVNATGAAGVRLYVGQTSPVGKGDPVGHPAFPPSATYGHCSAASTDGISRVLGIWGVENFPGGPTGALFEHGFDAAGNLVSTVLHYQIGDTLPGQTEAITGFVTQYAPVAVSSAGEILFGAYLETSGLTFFRGATPLVSPWGGGWAFTDFPTALLNNAGDHALGWGAWVGGNAVDVVSVNGEPTLHEGQVVAASSPHALEIVRQLGLGMDDQGRVLWWGSWDFPNFGTNALFLDRTALVMEGGWSSAGGVGIDRVGVVAVADVSPNGRWVVFDAVLANGNRAVCLLDTTGLPENYCTAGTSASGCRAGITALGVPSASAVSGFELHALPLEGGKDGLFFYGASGRQANPWGNGTSYRCVVPPTKRSGLLAGSGTPGACDGAFVDDLNARWCPACPKPNHNPGAGATVQAQLWYRDPQSTSNRTTSFSDALEFAVEP